MAFDYFDEKVALNDQTGNTLQNAVAEIFAMDDVGFTTPLVVTDMDDLPITIFRSSPSGIYPAFKVPTGQTQVIARSGNVSTPITSLFGRLLELIPNPDGQDDQLTIVTQSGSYVLAPVATTPIPDPTLGDDGQVLTINSGQWAIADPTGGGGTVGGILDGGAP